VAVKIISGTVSSLEVAGCYENLLFNESQANMLGVGAAAAAFIGDGLSAATLASANSDAEIKMEFFTCVVGSTAVEGRFYKVEFDNGQYMDFAVETQSGRFTVCGARDPIRRLVWMLPHKSKGHLAQRRSNLIGILIISMAAAIIFFWLGYFVGHEDRQFRLSRAKVMSVISFLMMLIISFRVCKKVFRHSIDTTRVFEAFGFIDPPNVNLPRGNSKAEKRYAAQTGERAVFFKHCRYRYDECDLVESGKNLQDVSRPLEEMPETPRS
jgi:hypothetical protein